MTYLWAAPECCSSWDMTLHIKFSEKEVKKQKLRHAGNNGGVLRWRCHWVLPGCIQVILCWQGGVLERDVWEKCHTGYFLGFLCFGTTYLNQERVLLSTDVLCRKWKRTHSHFNLSTGQLVAPKTLQLQVFRILVICERRRREWYLCFPSPFISLGIFALYPWSGLSKLCISAQSYLLQKILCLSIGHFKVKLRNQVEIRQLQSGVE